MKYLLIGGCGDGKRVELNGRVEAFVHREIIERPVNYDSPQPLRYEETLYCGHQLQEQSGKRILVYVARGEHHNDLIQHLVNNYRPCSD